MQRGRKANARIGKAVSLAEVSPQLAPDQLVKLLESDSGMYASWNVVPIFSDESRCSPRAFGRA